MTPRAQSLHDGNFVNADHHPCPDLLSPTLPKRPDTGPPIGLALSGGGFRATFAALGIARFLADVGLLNNVWISSSVSGGSVANGVLAKHWPALRARDFAPGAVDEIVIEPMIKKIAKSSLRNHLIKNVWRTVGSKTRTDLLSWAFDDWFIGDMTLDELDPGVRWVINAANMSTGTRFTFERTMLGDYVNGYLPSEDARIAVSLAAAASAAVPGAFAPVLLKDLRFPCQGVDTVSLLDGGAYDNTGIEVLNSDRFDDVFTICLAAGGIFKIGAHGKIPLVRDVKQSNAVLYRQSRALRTRDMFHRFTHNERKGLVFKLNTSHEAVEHEVRDDADALARVADFVGRYRVIDEYKGEPLAYIETSFNKFDEGLSRRLVRHGWWTAALTMTAFHPDMPALSTTTDAPAV